MSQYTEEDLEGLTEEERNDLLEGEEPSDGDDAVADANSEQAALKDAKAETETETANKASDAAGVKTEETPKEPEATADNKPKAAEPMLTEENAGEQAAEPAGQAEEAAVPDNYSSYVAQQATTEEAKTKIADIDKRLEEIAEKFDNGDLTAREFTQEQNRLFEEKTRLTVDARIAERSIEDSQNQWLRNTVPAFLANHTQYAPNTPAFEMLDAEVQRLQRQALAKGQDAFSPNILAEAHDNVLKTAAQLAGKTVSAANAQTPPAAKTTATKTAREMPPTLAHTPAAAISDTTDGGQYDYYDRLGDDDPEKLEKAYEKLPESERDNYLASGVRG